MKLQHINANEINGPVYILPISCVGIVVSHLLRRNGIEVAGFGDNNLEYAGKDYQGIPILSPEQAYCENNDATYIIATYRFRKELAEQLQELGANHIVYTGQFLNEDSFLETLNDMDEDAARSLAGWKEPKTAACCDAPYFWLAEPTFDKNLITHNDLGFFVDNTLRYDDWVNAIKKTKEKTDADFIRAFYIVIPSNISVHIFYIDDIINIIDYILKLDMPPRIITITCLFGGTNKRFADLLSQRLMVVGIPIYSTENLERKIEPICWVKPRIALHREKAYSDSEDRYQCIFCHISKNAGTSMNNFLQYTGATAHSHDKFISNVKAFDSERFERYFKFAIVRNPWDWLVSFYYFSRKQMAENNYFYPNVKPTTDNLLRSCKSFREAVFALKNCPAPCPQYTWICDKNDNILVDYIGRFENLTESFEFIAHKLGMDTSKPVPHFNATKHKHYTEYYDDEMIEIVREAYKKDIEMFGYEFGKHPGPNIVINPREDFVPAARQDNE